MDNTLLLRLEGPMQSWGERARWVIRDTSTEPTKSGIVGLLGCALGINADEELKKLGEAIKLGVRCDDNGQFLTDYHTVVEGVMSGEGKIKINQNTHKPETVVSWRQYLCDASFVIAIQAEPALIEKLVKAIQSPVWPIYLGRKCCPPAAPVFLGTGEYESLKQALNDKKFFPKTTPAKSRMRLVLESEPGKGMRRFDQTDSNHLRTFLPRYTNEALSDPIEKE